MPTTSMIVTRLSKVLVVIFLLLANLVFFSPFYFRGLLPLPGDLLVSFFFPWSGGGFPGFDPWTTHKEYLAADAIRQLLPWKDLAFDLIRHGQFPLWNPYNFSGTYLLANLQSSIFSPGSALFLIFPTLWAWVTNVVVIMTLFGFFTTLFLRCLKLSWPASLFGGLAAVSISYLVGWQEILVVTQSALFLPLTLLFVNKFQERDRKIYLWLISLFLAFSIFGGHIQTTVYVFLIVFFYMLFRRFPIRRIIICFLFGLLFAAVQILPTLEAYFLSARETQANLALLSSRTFPWGNIVTIFASDFLGNKASYNFQSFDYIDARAYFGVVAAVFAFLSLSQIKKNPNVAFFSFLAVFGLVFAAFPVALIFAYSHLPVLSSSIPARMIFVFEFAAVILSAFGFEAWFKQSRQERRSQIITLIVLLLVYGLLWFVSVAKLISFSTIALKNLIIPTATFLAASILILLPRFKKQLLFPALLALLLLAIAEPAYYFIKYQPFSKREFFFPPHPVLTYLQKNSGIDRFMGFGTSYLDNNFATYYRIFSAEGYDPLYIKRYGELIASAQGEQLPLTIPRSDARFPEADLPGRSRLMDILGVKYLLDKNDKPSSNWEPEYGKFPNDQLGLLWQDYKWKVYQRRTALPRFFLADSVEVETQPAKIISRLFDPAFNPKKTIIVETDPGISISSDTQAKVELLSYSPNRVDLAVRTLGNKLLFLSDAYYPGWQAFVNGKQTPILRADYAFRAVPVTTGNHQVTFKYEPDSFKIGALLTIISLGLSLGYVCFEKRPLT